MLFYAYNYDMRKTKIPQFYQKKQTTSEACFFIKNKPPYTELKYSGFKETLTDLLANFTI